MRFDLLRKHHEITLSRRQALKAGAAGAAAAAGAALLPGVAHAHEGFPDNDAVRRFPAPRGVLEGGDQMFDVAAVEAGAWAQTWYGVGDQRGTFNEVTPAKTARALQLLDQNRPVHTYNMGELLVEGFPAFVTTPARQYIQRLVLLGYDPGPDFGGFLQGTEPFGPNRISAHEERIIEGATYQIATQLDNLNHIGVGEMFYGGYRGPEIAETWGTTALGNEHMGPIITRGMVLDIVGLKEAQGATGDLFTVNGNRVLQDTYRITIDDIEAAMDRQGLSRPEPGDVVLFRTGWTHLVEADPERYLAAEPGIYLAEARYLARHRPAVIGSDTWALEVLDPAVTQGNAFPVHQVLLTGAGVRIGEAMVTEDLVNDGVFEFVFIITPQYAKGATAGSTPPAALAQPPT